MHDLPGLPDALRRFLDQRLPEFVALRRDLHRHPELGFGEQRTSDCIAGRLQALGYAVTRGLAGTGLVGTLRQGNGPRVLGLRADMDALPIAEQSGHAHRSVNAGVMHACGHDGHVAMLLAAADYLAQSRQFDGTLHLIFQPAEETLQGAQRLLDGGLLAQFPCDAVFGMHTLPNEPQGDWLFRAGPAMASADYLRVALRSAGGHAAHPHRAQDTVVAAASTIMALQTIVSRNLDPLQFGVVSIVSLDGASADNVIPAQVGFTVCVRTLEAGIRASILERIRAIVAAQARSFGVEAEISPMYGCPVLVNHPEQTALARDVAQQLFGAASVRESPPRTGSEDFSYFLKACPGSFVFLGAGRPGPASPPLHNACYDFNDDVLGLGAAFWVGLTQRYLAVAG